MAVSEGGQELLKKSIWVLYKSRNTIPNSDQFDSKEWGKHWPLDLCWTWWSAWFGGGSEGVEWWLPVIRWFWGIGGSPERLGV